MHPPKKKKKLLFADAKRNTVLWAVRSLMKEDRQRTRIKRNQLEKDITTHSRKEKADYLVFLINPGQCKVPKI